MFNAEVNAPCINIPFSLVTLAAMPEEAFQPSYIRLAEAVRRHLKRNANAEVTPTDIANVINFSQQRVGNFRRNRPVSKEAALAAEAKTGTSAAWILCGDASPVAIAAEDGPARAPSTSMPDISDPAEAVRRVMMQLTPENRQRVLQFAATLLPSTVSG